MKIRLISSIVRQFLLILSFCIFSLSVFRGIGFSESQGIKIIEPQNGAIVSPGQEIVVRIEALDRFEIVSGLLGVSTFIQEDLTTLPATFTITIPLEAAGNISIDVLGKDKMGKFVEDEITINVQQTATLQSLEINQDEIFVDLDWNGNIKGKSLGNFVTIYGIFSDGVKRILDDDPNTNYTSSDPSVISVDNKGNYQVYKVGQAAITISNSGLSKVIPVVYLKPHGIKPSENILPTTQINIQPQPNSAGWYNQDITITLTAQDNEGGSGVQEVEYVLAGMRGINSEKKTIQGNIADLIISQEGIARLGYYATDNERNREDTRFADISLDKTSPVITSAISPKPNQVGWHNSDVAVSFNATDSLSGVKSVTSPVTVSTEGAKQSIMGEALDIADNKATTQVTLNIDKTPPQISLELKSINLAKKEKEKGKEEDEGNWYEFIYSAEDNLSGLKNLQAGLAIIDPSGFKQELEVDNEVEIEIDEKKKELKIEAPNPQSVLDDLKDSLFNLNTNQVLQLKIKQGEPKWKLKQKPQGFEIQAPSVIFKAVASDIADNIAIKELEFKKEKEKK